MGGGEAQDGALKGGLLPEEDLKTLAEGWAGRGGSSERMFMIHQAALELAAPAPALALARKQAAIVSHTPQRGGAQQGWRDVWLEPIRG